jgi:hypothetical protein
LLPLVKQKLSFAGYSSPLDGVFSIHCHDFSIGDLVLCLLKGQMKTFDIALNFLDAVDDFFFKDLLAILEVLQLFCCLLGKRGWGCIALTTSEVV